MICLAGASGVVNQPTSYWNSVHSDGCLKFNIWNRNRRVKKALWFPLSLRSRTRLGAVAPCELRCPLARQLLPVGALTHVTARRAFIEGAPVSTRCAGLRWIRRHCRCRCIQKAPSICTKPSVKKMSVSSRFSCLPPLFQAFMPKPNNGLSNP